MLIFKGRIASSFNDVNFLVQDIIDILKTKCGFYNKSILFKISFMLREVLNNAVEHGNKFDNEKKVDCEVHCLDDLLRFVIQDEGTGISLSSEPFEAEDDYILRERHRGIKIIKELNFNMDIQGNKIIIDLETANIDKGE